MSQLYSQLLERAKYLQIHKKLVNIDGVLSDSFADEILSDINLKHSLVSQIRIAENITGVPLLCALEFDHSSDQTFMIFKNLKTNSLIDRKQWHLPKRLQNKPYKFYMLWMDSPERNEFYPDLSFPVVLKAET